MSKFFDQAQRYQDQPRPALEIGPELDNLLESIRDKAPEPARQNGADTRQLEGLLESIKVEHTRLSELVECRLDQCRKIHLSRAERLVFSGKREEAVIAMEAYRTLRTRICKEQGKQNFRSVVISSLMQGEGKTLSAANLAMCCSQIPQYKVLVVDADLRTSALTKLLNLPSAPGLGEILARRTSYDQAVMATEIQNLYALSAGECGVAPSELFADSRWKEFMAWASSMFNLIIVDSPPAAPLADFELIVGACDKVIAIVRPRKTERQQLQEQFGPLVSSKLLGVILNGAEFVPGYGSRYGYGYPESVVRRAQ